ncbi:STAS/SEC14 domain-containing protein [Snodgrassella gandavensis]|uniref:STAS/SEC14 domain-containing protein n=1 Tax=Snodgrassella gandavensis TaxID=2946698 RepID=UPI001EF537B5|nr:STAS/SEC14 domain-containing protein [Snodgrassella gandavensis]
MISIHEQSYGLSVVLYNEFTLGDFRQLEEALLKAIEQVQFPNLLLDMSQMKDFTVDMALEHLRFLRLHAHDFGRTAIIVDDIWIRLGARFANLLTLQRPKYFNDKHTAQKWLEQNRQNSGVIGSNN